MEYVTKPPKIWKQSLQFTFEYEDNELRLTSQQRIRKVPPPSDSLEGFEGRSGFWYIIVDSQGRNLYRRIRHNPIEYYTEFAPKSGEKPTPRKAIEDPRSRFTLLFPDIPEAVSIILYSSPLDIENDHEAATEIGRFNIRRDALIKEEVT